MKKRSKIINGILTAWLAAGIVLLLPVLLIVLLFFGPTRLRVAASAERGE